MSDDRGRAGEPLPDEWDDPIERPTARPIVKVAAIAVAVGMVLLGPAIYVVYELLK